MCVVCVCVRACVLLLYCDPLFVYTDLVDTDTTPPGASGCLQRNNLTVPDEETGEEDTSSSTAVAGNAAAKQ